jgi:DNA-directed RNA polymerase specialized sigma24 family protein
VSTRCGPSANVPEAPAARDLAEEVALVARARRDVLLRANRHQLRWEDLEDCFSQATLELVARARRGGTFANRTHIGSTLELRFVSRIRDQRRARAGRSPIEAALGASVPIATVGEPDLAIRDPRAGVEQLVVLREELRRVERLAQQLSPDQRLALASQLALQMSCEQFCVLHGWSPDKYRKVIQRARARLRALVAADDAAVPGRPGQSERQQEPAYESLPHT